MELVSLVQEGLQTAVEHGVSYRFGQNVLRHIDKALWVVEKCARWAVPPPLDQDERPQPELVRPLPWLLFLLMLVALRVARETISIFYLAFGKPPLRSADVVMYIQGKRRYLRTLKYQGNRVMRARSARGQQAWRAGPWALRLQALLGQAMCFQPPRYHNNNTHDVAIVKRSKRSKEPAVAAAPSETTMERLIEKIMVDLDADSDEDSSYTLTNVTGMRSDQSELTVESEDDSLHNNHSSTLKNDITTIEGHNEILDHSAISPPQSKDSSPETKTNNNNYETKESVKKDEAASEVKPSVELNSSSSKLNNAAKEETQNFLQNENKIQRKYQQSPKKIANGRTAKVAPVSKKETLSQVQGAEVPVVKLTNANEPVNGRKENSRPTN